MVISIVAKAMTKGEMVSRKRYETPSAAMRVYLEVVEEAERIGMGAWSVRLLHRRQHGDARVITCSGSAGMRPDYLEAADLEYLDGLVS